MPVRDNGAETLNLEGEKNMEAKMEEKTSEQKPEVKEPLAAEKPAEEKNEAREALEGLKADTASLVGSESISQSFIRTNLLTFLVSPKKAYDEISTSNKSIINGLLYVGLVAIVLGLSTFIFSRVFVGSAQSPVKESVRLISIIISAPLGAMLYEAITIVLVLGIALFLKNISLKRMTERPFIDNFFNSMAFTKAVALIGIIPFSLIVPFVAMNPTLVGDGGEVLVGIANHIGLIIYGWQLVLMYLVVTRFLDLKPKHALIALIPAALPFLQGAFAIIGGALAI